MKGLIEFRHRVVFVYRCINNVVAFMFVLLFCVRLRSASFIRRGKFIILRTVLDVFRQKFIVSESILLNSTRHRLILYNSPLGINIVTTNVSCHFILNIIDSFLVRKFYFIKIAEVNALQFL